MTSRLQRAMRQRFTAVQMHDDEGTALLIVVMLMLVLLVLATLVLGAVVSQVKPTTATQQSTRVVFAAESGLQVGLSQVRASTTALGLGSLSRLPCTVAGQVEGYEGTLSFATTIRYYSSDPKGRSAAWLADPANSIRCAPGVGAASQPSFAVLTATGADSSSGALVRSRSLVAQYAFKVSNINIPGGMIYTATGAACLQADFAGPSAPVRYVSASSCSSTNPLQQWGYDKKWHLMLASSMTTTANTVTGLCLTQPPLTQASPRTVVLQGCSLDSLNPLQLWSYEGGGHFRGQNATNTGYGNNCLFAGSIGSPVGKMLAAGGAGTCSANGEDYGSFNPEPRVGAGAASITTSQVVNFLQFGRCMDVTYEAIQAYNMILYPCKQDPSNTGKVLWNHKFLYGPESGQVIEPSGTAGMPTRIRVMYKDDPANTYCLTTPISAAQPSYPSLKTCDGRASQQYVRTYDTGDYATSYLFRTFDGRCLSVGPAQIIGGMSISTLVASACTGGPEQKWNAPPMAQDPRVSRELETTTPTS